MAEGKSPLVDKSEGLIIYAGVIRQPKKTNLAEYAGLAGSLRGALPGLLGKVKATAQRSSWKLDDGDHALHHFANLPLGVSFVCLAEVGVGKEKPFKFLVQLEERFTQAYSLDAVAAAREGAMQAAFEDKIQQLVESYNGLSAGESRARQMRGKLGAIGEDLQGAMAHLHVRDEEISKLSKKAEQMSDSSLILQGEATAMHRKVWWKNTRCIVCVVVVAVLIVLLIVWDLFG